MIAALVVSLVLTAPKLGDVAPDFNVKDIDGQALSLSALSEKGPVVLAFFPKAFTYGCTQEIRHYQERASDWEKCHATVVAISTDDVESLKRFRAETKAQYHFVSDAKGELAKLFETKYFLLNLSARKTFVVGRDRRIVSIQDGSDAIDPSGAISACLQNASKAP